MNTLAQAVAPPPELRRPPRAVRPGVVAVLLAAAVVVLAIVALGLGAYRINAMHVVQALVTDDGFPSMIVRQWRLPRVCAALAFGAALGLAGAVFQSLTRNPLGSPDVIGFSTGAYTGALIALTAVGGSVVSTSTGALLGGIGSAAAVYALAWRRGTHGARLIMVGVAVTALLVAVNTWLLLRVNPQVALGASIWGAGSLALVGWSTLRPALLALAVCVVLLALLRGPFRQLELGDDAARAHGVRAEPARIAIMTVGVALTALVTASAGPIAFVALAAPQIAHRLCGCAGLPLLVSALTGALLLLGADVVAQHVLSGDQPVGTVTVVIGGVYLLGLLITQARARR